MDVNEQLHSLNSQTGQATGGRSGNSKTTPLSPAGSYVTRKEMLEFRQGFCEILFLLLNLHITKEIDMEIPYMDIHLN
jgi:hypothetical protein